MKRGGNENQKASFFIFFDTAPHPKKNKKFIYIPPKKHLFFQIQRKENTLKIHASFKCQMGGSLAEILLPQTPE